ncbi:MAG: PspA/IM30 family protein [Calditrichia bacterium]
MNIFQRISKLLSANINHVLDKAEDPEVMVKQIIRDMEESIIELRRETVKAIGQQKQLEKQLHAAEDLSNDLEEKAGAALASGKEDVAREILAKRFEREEAIDTLKNDHKSAELLASQLKGDLFKLEDQVQIARRKKEELIRRKRSAEAQLRTQHALQKSRDAFNALTGSISDINTHGGDQIESYEQDIMQLEAEAEAAQEMMDMQSSDIDLRKLAKDKAIEDELEKLKKKLKK